MGFEGGSDQPDPVGGEPLVLFGDEIPEDAPWTELAFSETLLPAEVGVARSRCVSIEGDFTSPARHPMNGGAIPELIELELFDDETVDVHVDRWGWDLDGWITWEGRTTETPRGRFLVTVVDGYYTGILQGVGTTWILRPDAWCGHILIEVAEMEPWDWCGAEDEEEEALSSPPEALSTSPAFAQSPTGGYDTIDVLVVRTDEAEARWGGPEGFRGYANLMVHQVSDVLMRSGITGWRARLVGVAGSSELSAEPEDWDDTDETDEAMETDPIDETDEPVQAARLEVMGDQDILDLRDEVGADVVLVVLSRGYEFAGYSVAPSSLVDDPGLATYTERGWSSVGSDAADVAQWSFAHELFHNFDIQHKCSSPPCVNTTDPGQSTGYDNNEATGYWNQVVNPSNSADVPYRDLMASGGAPGCRLPVLGRVPTFGWRGDVGTPQNPKDPCRDSMDFDTYDERGFLPGATPFVNGGTPTGSSTGSWANANAGDWVTTPISGQGDLTPLQIIQAYKPDAGLVFDGQPIASLSPGSLGTPTSTAITLTWDASAYSLNDPTTCPVQTPQTCDLDSNPFYLSIGSAPGDEDAYGAWIGSDHESGGEFEVALTLPTLTQIWYARLWTQLDAGVWAYTEAVLNDEDILISCNTENPTYAPYPYNTAGCETSIVEVIASSNVDPYIPAIQVDLGASGTHPTPWAAAIRFDAFAPDTPYDVVVFGTDLAGTHFCCLYDTSEAEQAVELYGSSGQDLLTFTFFGSTLEPPPDDSVAWIAASAGLGGDDYLLGPTTPDTPWVSNGGNNGDLLLAFPGTIGEITGSNGIDALLIGGSGVTAWGGDHADILVSTNASGADVELHGEGGADVLCAASGMVKLVANESASATADALYVSSAWGGSFHAGTAANSSAATCGWSGFTSGWAGTCSYSLSQPPTECAALVTP
ncbi:MAG TPA: hypothetical protein PKA64_03395 [Myxococcota bacterium]|nr:hypothetical protein [Myxococcota bacterium]